MNIKDTGAKFSNIHSIRDIMNIYEDCKNFKVRVWNFTDFKYENIAFDSLFTIDGEYELRMKTTRHPLRLVTVADWKLFFDKFKDPLELDYSPVIIKNSTNGHLMTLHFSGSSNTVGEVNFNLDYCDPEYRKWKRDLRMTWMKIKYKLNKLLGK